MERIGQYILNYIKGKTPKQLYEVKEQGMLPYLSPDYLRGKDFAEFYAFPTKKTIVVEDGEVIVLWDGSNAGEIFISKRGILASTMVKLDFDKKLLDKDFYAYSFKYLEYFLKAKTAGSGIPHADKGVIKKLSFFKPESKTEQTAIASILLKVDKAIESVQNSIKAAEKLKKALLQNLLTGKMKPNGSFRKEEEFYIDEKYGKIPKGWRFDKVRNLTLRVSDGEHLTPEYQTAGLYLLSAENVLDNGLSLEKPKYIRSVDCDKFRKRCDPDYGDVLIVSRGAGIGRTCKVNINEKFALMASVILIKPNNNILSGGYLAQYLKSYNAWVELQKLSGTTAQQAIYLTHLKKVNLIYPIDIKEQENISNILENFDNEIALKQAKIQTLERLKKSLMQNLLTGKKRLSQEIINKLIQEIETD